MIHCYKRNGINIILDVNSGAVHIADDVCAELAVKIQPPMSDVCPEYLITLLANKYTRGEIEEAYGELLSLYRDGMLFTEDCVPETKISSLETAPPIKALCLHVSHDCNLRCGYCFASTGDFGTGRKIMSREVARAAIDFVIEKSGGRRNIEIDFFGGEPLMAFDTIKDTVEYAKNLGEKHGKNFRFTVTTNGVLLDDEKIEYINREMSNVVLSLDGRRNVNDAVRKTVNGQGSYDIIVPKFKKLAAQRQGVKDYYIRGTFTAQNLDFANDVLDIAENGFEQISVEPVATDDEKYEIRREHLQQIFDEYDRLTDEMEKRQKSGNCFNFFHFAVDLTGGPCIIKRIRGCGAGSEYVAVTPDGDVYPCHRFVGNKEFKMGNIMHGKQLDSEISKKFRNLNVYSRKKCADCWAKFYCSGGCSASNYSMSGDLNEPYDIGCEMQKKRLECAIYLKAASHS